MVRAGIGGGPRAESREEVPSFWLQAHPYSLGPQIKQDAAYLYKGCADFFLTGQVVNMLGSVGQEAKLRMLGGNIYDYLKRNLVEL